MHAFEVRILGAGTGVLRPPATARRYDMGPAIIEVVEVRTRNRPRIYGPTHDCRAHHGRRFRKGRRS